MDNCPKKDCHEPNALIFRKVIIPASVADDSVTPPKDGDYCNTLVEYEATGNVYLFPSDGTWVMLSANSVEMMEALDREISEREEADTEIWNEIETIEAGSDVVDIVGTYAELQQYDTSTLQNNDVIKVLADETRDDAITYYRWSTSTEAFTYVGAEGPYYTASEVDTLLAGKQGTLTAGTNITIAADNTISATDTTYNAFAGATASVAGTSGLVPAPSAGDQNKVLMGNGTWGEGAANTIFYRNSSESGTTRHIYKSPDMTGVASMQDLLDANEKGQVILRLSTASHPEDYSDAYLQNAYVGTNDYQMLFLNEKAYESYNTTQPTDTAFIFSRRELQDKLTAGTNVQINGTTISATDTTYSDFIGTDGLVAGTHGLVPAPATTDTNKYLKSDGTWATVQASGGGTTTLYLGNNTLYKEPSYTTALTGAQVIDLCRSGEVIVEISYSDAILKKAKIIAFDDSNSGAKFIALTVRSYNGEKPALWKFYYSQASQTAASTYGLFTIQPMLIAGANISISQLTNTISVTGMPVLYGSQGQNTDGAVTQKVFTDTVGDVESILQILNSGAGV